MENDNVILTELSKMSREIFRVFKIRCGDSVELSLTNEQIGLLFKIAKTDKDVIQKDLADCLGKDKSTILRLTDALEKNDLVRRVTDKNDRRKSHLMITKKGNRVLEQHMKTMNNLMAELEQGLTESDLQTFFKVVNHLKNKASIL